MYIKFFIYIYIINIHKWATNRPLLFIYIYTQPC